VDRSVVAKRLNEARRGAGLSQKALGIKAGIDEFSASARVNQYERGKHLPDLLTLGRIGQVLNVPLAYFFCQQKQLADLVVGFHRLSAAAKTRLLKALEQLTDEQM
jgi:transcriptional regulator with XRE-family HTH domain